jgi:phenylacetate-CoA ligase
LKPIPAKAVSKFIYPLHEKLMQRPTFAYLKQLEQSQWLTRQEIEQLQLRKLKQLLIVARDHCPWHRNNIENANLELGPDSQLTLEDLRKLPLMDKKTAQENGDEMVWKGVPGGAHLYNTGGSSGSPLIFYFGRWRQASDAAGRMRAQQWFGVEVGAPEVYLWGAPVELNKTDKIKTIRDRLVNHLFLNAFEMSARNMDKYTVAIGEFNPECIYGYASSIALLAAHISDRGIKIRLPRLKVVCTTGEPLYDDQRQLIQSVFKVPAANEFGSRDIGFTAHESPEGQMLLMSESIIMEILDANGEPIAPGASGEAVLTGLCSDAQPLIRYRTGDVVRMSDKTCREGRGLHVIDQIFGRTTDFVVKADGTIMHALAVIYVLRAVQGVGEFKLIQQSVNFVETIVVPNRFWTDESEQKIRQGLKSRLGEEVEVKVNVVDTIAPEASGKYRYVVSHVALPNGVSFSNTNQ